MAQQETVLTETQADEILTTIPANAQEACQIAQAIADSWNLRVSIGKREQEDNDAA